MALTLLAWATLVDFPAVKGRGPSRIERGELTGRLDAETTLAQRYGISRDTVRRALARLATDGLIQSTRGRGTFVLPRPT